MPDTTHFGFQQVPVEEKARKVGEVFDSVASRYDLMNDLMSLGIHRLWKRMAVELAGVRRGARVLDLAGGTGDLAAKFSRLVENKGMVLLADINASMLTAGRDRLLDQGITDVDYCLSNAENLPFADNSFDLITIAFGLRNVTHKEQALHSMYRALKPGGRVLILEFSKVSAPVLKQLYDLYSFKVLPVLGGLIAKDADSYRYLAESIRMHPDQETLLDMMGAAGFENCDYHNLSGGIVAIHRGFKF
jgi:demethylmenaquinone methyltransferase / 2-methoxy-6-polyprenyl-1,4-benzoquinol methylase